VGRPETDGTVHAPSERGRLRLELAVGGSLTAALANDGRAVDFVAEGGARVIRFDHLHVVDARGRPLEAFFERGDDVADPELLAIVVDDRDANYPITIDPLATSPAWTAESDQSLAEFGFSAATAGDVNGDGYSDVIVGAFLFDNGQSNEGRVFVYPGAATGLSFVASWTTESDQANAQFGHAVATAGDVNGDGFSDVIVGARRFDNSETDEGRAFVYHGSASGLSLTPNWSAESDQANALFGFAVATAGDVNGDGFSDVIVGARSYDNGETDEGRAFVYHGSASGLSPTANWTAEGGQASAGLGYSVMTAGDVNADGFSDVIVGATFFDNDQSNEGRALVYHGSASGLSPTADWTAESDQADSQFGGSVAAAGDVNGDGFGDVIVGAIFFDNGQSNEGRAYVYHGSAGGLSLTPNWTAESNQAVAWFGGSVATAGDVNGDGFADVIVGATLYDNGQSNEGGAFVYHGGAGGLALTANWTGEGGQADADYGFVVGTAGDVNGDGFSDVIVGADLFDNSPADEGRAFVYHGSASGVSLTAGWTAESDQTFGLLGSSVSSAGDVNGDGFADVIVGAESYTNGESDEGGAFVYHGSAIGPNLVPDWSAESDQAFAFMGSTVAAAGDVNGDGYGDVIVGAYAYDDGGIEVGRVLVYHGSPSGLSVTPSWTIEGGQEASLFGWSVAGAGDVNGDGFGDVIVGAQRFDNGESDEGRAFVYHGSASGLSLTPYWAAESNQVGAHFGVSVAGAGDVNGDGFSDVIVSADLYDNGQNNEGRAFVYHGSANGLSLVPNWTAESDQADARFGYSVATAGDVNGDGFSDVIVGAIWFDNIQTDEGRAFVYHGSPSGLSLTANWTAESNQASASFGASVATAGDVNGDGFSDVIVGASEFDGGQTDEGGAWIYHGSPTGLRLTPNWNAESDQASAFFGWTAGSAGDVNGDGFADVIVGSEDFTNDQTAEGRAFVYCGNGGPARRTLPRQQRIDGLTPIAPLGRSDSQSGFRIRATMLSASGRTRVQMEHEVKPRGTLFNGLNTVVSGFSDIGDDGQHEFDRLITGLDPGTVYHWRVRAKYDLVRTPFQRNGPWVHVPINGWNEADLRTADIPASVVPRMPARFDLLAAGPNPGRGRCGVLLVMAEPARLQVEVLDIQGRTVAMLAKERAYTAGSHALMWDGRDVRGVQAPAGVYLVRARNGAESAVRKAVLTR
jgi:hypothetical protein